MKNLLNNLLNWVLKKGPSETKKDQAWEEKEQAGSKKEQAGSKKEQAGSKKDQVKRTKLSEKDQVKGSKLSEKDQVKRTKLSEKDQVKRTKLVQKRTKLEMGSEAREVMGSEAMSVKGSEAMSVKGSEAMSANHALITQLSRNNHPISLRAIRYVAVLFMVFMVGIGNAWGQDTISVAETGDDSDLLKIILAIIAAVGGVGLTIYYTKKVKKSKSSNNQKTEGDFSPATNNTQQGNGNTIDQSTNKGATIFNLSSKPILSDRRAADFEQDRQTVESMMSNFSINIVQEFLFGNNQNRLDNRLFDIRDAWYSKYNPVEPIFNNPETERIMKAFYVKFNELIELCANYYDPMNNSDRYSKIRGLICDSFDDRKEDEEHFEQVLQKIKEVEPVYTAMREHVIRRYKINLEELSKKYEGRN